MEAVIRPARPGEEESLLRAYDWLTERSSDWVEAWDPVRARVALAQAIASERALVAAAERADALIGVCTAYRDIHSVRCGERVWIEDLIVHPDEDLGAVGGALFDHVCDWARERGATHVELDAGSGDDAAEAVRGQRETRSELSIFGWRL